MSEDLWPEAERGLARHAAIKHETPIGTLNRILCEYVMGAPEVRRETSGIRLEKWSREQLAATIRKHDRVKQGEGPPVIVELHGHNYVVDGVHRVNATLMIEDGHGRDVIIITPGLSTFTK